MPDASSIVWQKAVPCKRNALHPYLGMPIFQFISMQPPIFAGKHPPAVTDDLQCLRTYLQEVITFLQHFSMELPQTILDATQIYNELTVNNESLRWARAARKNKYGVTPPKVMVMSVDDVYMQDRVKELKSLIRTSLSTADMKCKLTKRPDMEKYHLWPQDMKSFETDETGTGFKDEEKAMCNLDEFAGLLKLAPSAVCIHYFLLCPDTTNVDDERTRRRDKAVKTLELIMRELVLRNLHPELLRAEVDEYDGGTGDSDLIFVDLSPQLKPPPTEVYEDEESVVDFATPSNDGESLPVEEKSGDPEKTKESAENANAEKDAKTVETDEKVDAEDAKTSNAEEAKP